MITVMKNRISLTIILFLALSAAGPFLFSQEKSMTYPNIQFQYIKNTEGQRILKTKLTYSAGEKDVPLSGKPVTFTCTSGNVEVLGTVNTDDAGVAKIELSKDSNIATDASGMWSFIADFSGGDTLAPANSDLSVMDVSLEATYTEIDSVKTITVKAFTTSNGKEVPVSGETVIVGVPRMFAFYKVGDITLDENGSGSIEFPSDLPGNNNGEILVTAKFEESPVFGNVEKVSSLKWGVPTEYSMPSSHRALWTKTAPKWMIYTLSILLAGVWGHYLFTIISLIRIRLDAKKQEELDNYGKKA